MWMRKLLPSLDLSIFPSLCLWDTHIWTEISSCLMQTYLHVFINVWARGFHSIMDTFISSIFFFFSEEMVTARWESGFSVTFFSECQLRIYVQNQHLQMVSPKSMGLVFVRNVSYASGSILPFCLGSLAWMIRQNKAKNLQERLSYSNIRWLCVLFLS